MFRLKTPFTGMVRNPTRRLRVLIAFHPPVPFHCHEVFKKKTLIVSTGLLQRGTPQMDGVPGVSQVITESSRHYMLSSIHEADVPARFSIPSLPVAILHINSPSRMNTAFIGIILTPELITMTEFAVLL